MNYRSAAEESTRKPTTNLKGSRGNGKKNTFRKIITKRNKRNQAKLI
jgi:hypothetical protein